LDISVVIATYDPPASFARTLRALLCGWQPDTLPASGRGDRPKEAPPPKAVVRRGPSVEVLVVDNHPFRTSEPIVAPFLEEAERARPGQGSRSADAGAARHDRRADAGTPPEVRLLWEPRRGKCRAVNRGIHAASGSVLHFLDQDNVPGEGYLANIWRAFQEDPTATVVTGRVEPAAEEDPPLTLKRSLQREEHRHPLVPAAAGHGNNLSVRRQALAEVGFFDPRFGPGTFVASGEDTDLIYRLARAGHRILYEPSIWNTHERPPGAAPGSWLLPPGSVECQTASRSANHRARLQAPGARSRSEATARLGYARGRGAFYMKHIRRRDPWVARLCYWELRPCLAALARGRGDYPDPWLNLRGLLAGMAWMAVRGPV
jgi:cellulose synthase/poly-beta-1,6-N-acetylglucosamine synthase-like glycosyltransferase